MSERTRRLMPILAAIVLLASAGGGYAWWQSSRHVRDTDNAYVNADIAQVSSLVAGPVSRVLAHDNQFVHKGDVLFEVDRRPFEVALAKARARLASAELASRQDAADVGAAAADVERERVALQNAGVQLQRTEELVKQKFLSQQALDDARAKSRTQSASLAAADAKLERARQAVAGGIAASPEAMQARADIAQAELDLEHTRIVAPADGWLTNFSLVAGSSVAPGTPVAALIVDGSYWVDANFKETQLAGLAPGQGAVIEVDMYPKHPFRGRVESLSGGTGTAFSLLPPQNATGNWVKVTQRVPVKVRVLDADAEHPLRVGATAAVSIRVD
jgi:membrane fusion protein (multidrug efflux system)